MTFVAYALAVVAIWVLAWGSLSVANVLGGLLVAGFLFVIAPDTWPRRLGAPVRPIPIARFTVFFLRQVVRSNLTLARDALLARPRHHPGVIAVPVDGMSSVEVTLLASVIALSPGTIVLHTTVDKAVAYVHVLDLDDVEASRREIGRYVELIRAAFGASR